MICKDDYFRQEFPFASRLNMPTFECTPEGVNSLVKYLRKDYCFHIVNAFLYEKSTGFVIVDPVNRQDCEREWLIEIFRWCVVGLEKVIVMDAIVPGSFKVNYVQDID